MPETMLATMLEISARQRQQDREDEMCDRLMKSQASREFAAFARDVEKSEILSEAFDSGDFSKVDKMVELKKRIEAAF